METIGFFAKKIISIFAFPVGLGLVLIFLGLALSAFRSRRRLGQVSILAGAILLLVMSSSLPGYFMLHRLEEEAGPYCSPDALARNGVRNVVVLGGAVVTKDSSPADRHEDALFRVMEGIRLFKGIRGSLLIISGGSTPLKSSDPEAMADLPLELGVPRRALVLETRAWDTLDEARLFADKLGNSPFALVTSASHMARATKIFRDRGLNPIPCPCNFKALETPPPHLWVLPTAEGLVRSTSGMHEYLGRLWIKLRSLII
jgi:uncharacterized SAM-binding protein YcdF (DUF218 family)